MAAVETQIVQGLVGVVSLSASAGIAYLSSHAKQWLTNHANAQVSSTANDVIDGLTKIADSVVHDFNGRILSDAQANGVLTPELYSLVKKDAVASVKDQGAGLVKLGTSVVGNVEALIPALVEKAFKATGISPTVVTQTPETSVPPASA